MTLRARKTESVVRTFSFDREIIFPVIFAPINFWEGFSCATRDEARSFLRDGCPEAMSWFVVLLKTTEMEERQ
jgi:hypothetical protein